MAALSEQHHAEEVYFPFTSRKPYPNAVNTIPESLLELFRIALKKITQLRNSETSDRLLEENRCTIATITLVLAKLCDSEQTRTPELQIQAVSRITGAVKEIVLGDFANGEHLHETMPNVVRCLLYDVAIPALLEHRIRYLHRGITTLLRCLCKISIVDTKIIEAQFLRFVTALMLPDRSAIDVRTERGSAAGQTNIEKVVGSDITISGLTDQVMENSLDQNHHPIVMTSVGDVDNVVTFLNTLDCLSSTLMTVFPSIFENTFYHIFPLLGDSLHWCVTKHSASFPNCQNTENSLKEEKEDPSEKALLGRDLEQIRFCVRVVASFVHKYLGQLTNIETSVLASQFSRFVAPAIMMLSSCRFPKDVLNATGLLVASLITARHCNDQWVKEVCACICSTGNKVSDTTSLLLFSAEQKKNALETVVLCFSSSADDFHRLMSSNLEQIQQDIQILFCDLTINGCFALLKGILAHFSSPIHGNADTIGFLLKPIALDSSASSQTTVRILYDFIQPIALKFATAVELPEARFMALQTIDAMIRHMDTTLGHLRTFCEEFLHSTVNENFALINRNERKSKITGFRLGNHSRDALQSLLMECVVPQPMNYFCQVAMELMMEIWDDPTAQVSSAFSGTFHVLLSLHKVLQFFSSNTFQKCFEIELPQSTVDSSWKVSSSSMEASPFALIQTTETFLSILSLSSERRSKYHALLDLLSWMSCGEVFAGLLFYFSEKKYFSLKEVSFHNEEENSKAADDNLLQDLAHCIRAFSSSLIDAGCNHKVASAAGDTLTKLFDKLTREKSIKEQEEQELMSVSDQMSRENSRTVCYHSHHLSYLRSVILSCVARAMTAARTVKNVSFTITETASISLLSANFVCPLMKVDKSLVGEILNIMAVDTISFSNVSEDRDYFTQSIVEVLMRARGVGIDIQEHLQPNSKVFSFIIESLQSIRFEQRIAALQLCTLSVKKIEAVTLFQTTVVLRFLTLNMHLGGDTAARKLLVDTFRQWITRVVNSYDRLSPCKGSKKENKQQENNKKNNMDPESYAKEVVVPHLISLTQLFAFHLGKTVSEIHGWSAERKVTACISFTTMLKSIRQNDHLTSLLLETSSFLLQHVTSLLVLDLSDGWSQMRFAAKALLQELVQMTKRKCLKHLSKDNGSSVEEGCSTFLESTLKQVRSASTFRAAEGAVQRYMILRDGKYSDHPEPHHKNDPNESAKALFGELEEILNEIRAICQKMESQVSKEMYETVLRHPLHGMLSLCSELFSSLQQSTTSVIPRKGLSDSYLSVSALVVHAANKLIHVCGAVIRTFGILAGQEALLPRTNGPEKDDEGKEDIIVDCRGHVYDRGHEQTESMMRLVVNNTWLSIRVASLCLQRVVALVETTLMEFSGVKSVCDDLVHALLLTKHNGIMRSVRAALTSLMEVLLRSRDLAFYGLPAHFLWLLLGSDGVSSEDPSRMLRRSQGLPHAILAILEAEDNRAPLVLLPETMRTLTRISKQRDAKETTVGLSQRSNALNVLKFIFENKRFAECMLSYAEEGFAIATDGFDHTNWGVRNSSLMLFSAVLPRLIGQSVATAAGMGARTTLSSVLKRTPHCIEYAYKELCKSLECETHASLTRSKKKNDENDPFKFLFSESDVQQDLRVLPVLQMFSMMTPDPFFRLHKRSLLYLPLSSDSNEEEKLKSSAVEDRDNSFCERDISSVVRRCGASKNLMIRAGCAVALPCLLASSEVENFVRALAAFLCEDCSYSSSGIALVRSHPTASNPLVQPRINTIHGVLLQLQQIHARYLGTLESNQRLPVFIERTHEMIQALRKSILYTLCECQKFFEAASKCCPTVCSTWLNLLSDVLYFSPSCDGESAASSTIMAEQMVLGVRFVVQIILSYFSALRTASDYWPSSSSFSMFPWSKADWTSSLNAASQFLVLCLRRSDVWNETTNEWLQELGVALMHSTNCPAHDPKHYSTNPSHSRISHFLSFLCHTLHAFYTEKYISSSELVDILCKLELDGHYSLIHGVLYSLEEALRSESITPQRSWKVIMQSDYLDFLSDVVGNDQLVVSSLLAQMVLKALKEQSNSFHHNPSWCGAALRFLALFSKQQGNALDPDFVWLLQYFGEPERGQSMRAAALEALELLLPKVNDVLQNVLPVSAHFSQGEVFTASSLMILLLKFLVDDTYDVRERACRAWKAVLPISQIAKDQCTCVFSVCLALRAFVKVCPDCRESVHSGLESLRACTASMTMEDTSDDEEILFYKESDNMFFEETLLGELASFVLVNEDKRKNEGSFGEPSSCKPDSKGILFYWPGLSEMLEESERSQSLSLSLIKL